jgi:hypothetical protein
VNVDNLRRFEKKIGKRITVEGLLVDGGKEGLLIVLADKSSDAIVIAPVPASPGERISRSKSNKLLEGCNELESKFQGKHVRATGKLFYLPYRGPKEMDGKSRQGESSHLYFSVSNLVIVEAPSR